MVTEYEKCMEKRITSIDKSLVSMEKRITSIDKSLVSISKSLAKIARAEEKAQAESNREMNDESWDVFDNLSKLSGTKLL